MMSASLRRASVAWLAVAALGALADRALAHDWYTGRTNPVTGLGCCGGVDCAPLGPDDVRRTSSGWSFRWRDGRWYEIAGREVQAAPDGYWHGCKWGAAAEPRLCLFAPLGW